jgi:hypothetical protein
MVESVECIEIEDDFDIEVEDYTESTLDLIFKRVRIGKWLQGLGITNMALIGIVGMYIIGIGIQLWREAEAWEPEGLLDILFAEVILTVMFYAAVFFVYIGLLILFFGNINLGFIIGARNIKNGGNYWTARKTIKTMIVFCMILAVISITTAILLLKAEDLSFSNLMAGISVSQVLIIGILFYLLDDMKDTRWTFDQPLRIQRSRKGIFRCRKRSMI